VDAQQRPQRAPGRVAAALGKERRVAVDQSVSLSATPACIITSPAGTVAKYCDEYVSK